MKDAGDKTCGATVQFAALHPSDLFQWQPNSEPEDTPNILDVIKNSDNEELKTWDKL